MAKKIKKNKVKNSRSSTNGYHNRIKKVFVAEGLYSIYTFFTFGKKLFLHSSLNDEQVVEITDLEREQYQLREDMSSPTVLEVIRLKTQNRLEDWQQYFLPSMKQIYEEFWVEICLEQEKSLSEKGKEIYNFAKKLEDYLLYKNAGWIVEQPVTYNYFGTPVAYGEEDRQWIDYHMAQGNFDAALSIHLSYVKE
ncbi:hypothetical protein SAMN05192559_1174 [Halobacillus karajensis]|uniref:hypothetical protein n=1 Tax=Halobacillus karajensis TaxID=195088 RepID=UPI0008A73A02|nr:hypothetical protein [Halobacillus karajensis]SEI13266.1 hypothetical protein SAMN05192559_1174 [Halobacillus karajensis]